jgi:hypothetical protein
MSALGKTLIAIAAIITFFCFLVMFTDYLQPPTHRLGPDPGFHGAISSDLIPMLVVIVVALLSLMFWPKRR